MLTQEFINKLLFQVGFSSKLNQRHALRSLNRLKNVLLAATKLFSSLISALKLVHFQMRQYICLHLSNTVTDLLVFEAL